MKRRGKGIILIACFSILQKGIRREKRKTLFLIRRWTKQSIANWRAAPSRYSEKARTKEEKGGEGLSYIFCTPPAGPRTVTNQACLDAFEGRRLLKYKQGSL